MLFQNNMNLFIGGSIWKQIRRHFIWFLQNCSRRFKVVVFNKDSQWSLDIVQIFLSEYGNFLIIDIIAYSNFYPTALRSNVYQPCQDVLK